jgi:hypothetical protein
MAVKIRRIRPDDRQGLALHIKTLSPESRYRRFHGLRKGLTAQELSLLTHPDFINHVALVAAISKRHEQIVGDGRYVRMPNSREAELALSVNGSFQRKVRERITCGGAGIRPFASMTCMVPFTRGGRYQLLRRQSACDEHPEELHSCPSAFSNGHRRNRRIAMQTADRLALLVIMITA